MFRLSFLHAPSIFLHAVRDHVADDAKLFLHAESEYDDAVGIGSSSELVEIFSDAHGAQAILNDSKQITRHWSQRACEELAAYGGFSTKRTLYNGSDWKIYDHVSYGPGEQTGERSLRIFCSEAEYTMSAKLNPGGSHKFDLTAELYKFNVKWKEEHCTRISSKTKICTKQCETVGGTIELLARWEVRNAEVLGEWTDINGQWSGDMSVALGKPVASDCHPGTDCDVSCSLNAEFHRGAGALVGTGGLYRYATILCQDKEGAVTRQFFPTFLREGDWMSDITSGTWQGRLARDLRHREGYYSADGNLCLDLMLDPRPDGSGFDAYAMLSPKNLRASFKLPHRQVFHSKWPFATSWREFVRETSQAAIFWEVSKAKLWETRKDEFNSKETFKEAAWEAFEILSATGVVLELGSPLHSLPDLVENSKMNQSSKPPDISALAEVQSSLESPAEDAYMNEIMGKNKSELEYRLAMNFNVKLLENAALFRDGDDAPLLQFTKFLRTSWPF